MWIAIHADTKTGQKINSHVINVKKKDICHLLAMIVNTGVAKKELELAKDLSGISLLKIINKTGVD